MHRSKRISFHWAQVPVEEPSTVSRADNHLVQSPAHELPLRLDLISRQQNNVGSGESSLPPHELPLRFDVVGRRQDNVRDPVTGQSNTPMRHTL